MDNLAKLALVYDRFLSCVEAQSKAPLGKSDHEQLLTCAHLATFEGVVGFTIITNGGVVLTFQFHL